MVLFIAINGSFLPIFGDTSRQTIERQNRKIAHMEDQLATMDLKIQEIQNNQIHHAITIALAGILASIAIIIAKSAK